MVHPARSLGALALRAWPPQQRPAESNRRGDAGSPELASYGPLAVGVRTIRSRTNRPDILNTKTGEPTPRYDHALAVEVWCPRRPGTWPAAARTIIRLITRARRGGHLHGRAVRDAAPSRREAGIRWSSCRTAIRGNRYLLSPGREPREQRGYVVASIDHKDSTYDDQRAFASTLYNRPFDVLSVLNELQRLGGRSRPRCGAGSSTRPGPGSSAIRWAGTAS